MSKHWKEPLDPSRHLDFMSGSEVGGRPRKPPHDPLVQDWAYFVRVNGFTFEFASLDQVRRCLAYCREKTHPARRQPGIHLEHYWQRWFERLPKGMLRGGHRERVVGALQRALAEFERGTHVDRVLWTGRAAGREWCVRQVDWVPPGGVLADVWSLIIETTDAGVEERISSWWSPDERILGGTLAGWSKSAIGNLKRALARAADPMGRE